MKHKLLINYISIIFVIATFVSSLHHHHGDIQEHNDCQICTVQHNITDIDTPTNVSYLILFSISSEATLNSLKELFVQANNFTFSARAPPSFS